MKKLLIVVALVAFYGAGYLVGHSRNLRIANELVTTAANAEGFEGGASIRHASIGVVTNVIITPTHVAVYGSKGSREWYP